MARFIKILKEYETQSKVNVTLDTRLPTYENTYFQLSFIVILLSNIQHKFKLSMLHKPPVTPFNFLKDAPNNWNFSEIEINE